MTTRSSRQDHSRVQALWRDVGERPDLFTPTDLLARVTEIVPCDYASVNEIDEVHGAAVSRYLPRDAIDHADYRAFEWHVHEHPMLRELRATNEGAPRRLSDMLSPVRWHRLGLYGEFFRSMHVEHQAAFTTGDATASTAAAVVFNRAVHDFDDRDMAVFRAVRPLFQLLHRLGAERRLAAAARLALDHPGQGVAVLGPLGHIESVDEVSARALTAAFGSVPGAGELAPAAVRAWLGGDAPALTFGAPDCSVRVRRGPRIGDRRTVLVQTAEQPLTAGLTPREREVLSLVAAGTSNRAAARRLGISTRTVEKHLEHAYLKLEVENRTAAAAVLSRARAAAGLGHDRGPGLGAASG